jgi:AGZA family xanthine/uracil permease-like MFS transporter
MTMAYIVFVNPAILGTEGTGLPITGVFFATCVAASAASIAMGVFANYPLALAPGLGINAIVAFTLILELGLSWQQAMAVIVIEGLLVTVLVLTNLREAVMNAIPMSLKLAIAVGIGLFIAFIGLKNAGIVVQNPATYLALGDFTQGPVLLAIFGLVLTLALVARGVRGGILIGIVLTGAVGMVFGIVPLPGGVVDFRFDTSTIGGGVLAIPEVLRISLIPVIFALFMTDFFDTIGTAVAVARGGGMTDEQGQPPNADRLLLVDSAAASFGGAMGTSSVTTYVESGAGVAEGARTGLASMATAVLFALSLLFLPIIALVGQDVKVGEDTFIHPAIAPALVMVGYLMIRIVADIDWTVPENSIPAFLTIAGIPLTFSIAAGIGFGVISYVLVMTAARRAREIHPLMWGIAPFFVAFFAADWLSAHVF